MAKLAEWLAAGAALAVAVVGVALLVVSAYLTGWGTAGVGSGVLGVACLVGGGTWLVRQESAVSERLVGWVRDLLSGV